MANLDMTMYFEATAESYFNHLTRDGIEAALTEIKKPDFASDIARMKKAEAAAYAEAQTKGTAWLPSPLRFATILQEPAGDAAVGSDDHEEACCDDATDIIDDDTEAVVEMNTLSEAAE